MGGRAVGGGKDVCLGVSVGLAVVCVCVCVCVCVSTDGRIGVSLGVAEFCASSPAQGRPAFCAPLFFLAPPKITGPTPPPSAPRPPPPLGDAKRPAGHQRWVWDCVFSVDAAYLVTVSSDCTARLWDLSTGDAIRVYSGHHKGAVACALNDSALDGRDAE
jgi:hypothetical protein